MVIMRKEDVEKLLRERPFKPFEVRMIDGHRFRFHSPEQILVSNGAIWTLDGKGDVMVISLGLIAALRQGNGHGRRSSRRK
jgi:hypothetical protein